MAALRVERERLLELVAKVDADIQEATEAAQGCAAELERLHFEAFSATPELVVSLVR